LNHDVVAAVKLLGN